MTLLIKKKITGEALLNAGAPEAELDQFVKRYGLFTPLIDEDVTYIQENEMRWEKWLIDNDFLYEDVVFKPIIFTIPDKKMATYIWHRLNCAENSSFKFYTDDIIRGEGRRGDLPPVPRSPDLMDRVWRAFNAVFDPREPA